MIRSGTMTIWMAMEIAITADIITRNVVLRSISSTAVPGVEDDAAEDMLELTMLVENEIVCWTAPAIRENTSR